MGGKAVIAFDYIKSNSFRVLHVDGAHGGPHRDGLVLNLYSERKPIPKTTVHPITQLPDQEKAYSIGDELVEKRKELPALVREVEACVIMNRATAESIAKFIIEQLQIELPGQELLKDAKKKPEAKGQ